MGANRKRGATPDLPHRRRHVEPEPRAAGTRFFNQYFLGSAASVGETMTRTAATRKQTIDVRLDAARAHEAAGCTQRAESLYRQILGKDARHAGALHALGLMARKDGRAERAVQLLSKAAAAAPAFPAVGTAIRVTPK